MTLPSHSLTLSLILATTLLASATADVAPSSAVKGSIFCVDCDHNYDYSGVRIRVTCDQMKKSPAAMAIVKPDGSFKSTLPSNLNSAVNCQAKLLGGPNQLYSSEKNMASKIVKVGETYTTSTALKFASSCLTVRKCGTQFGSSKTVDLPIPREYGLPPTSYYVPVLPIIGIP